MGHHNDDQHDALNDYLDSLAGAPPPASRAGELDAGMHDGVDHFFDLAEQAGMAPRAKRQSGRPTMNATLPASGALPAPHRTSKRGFTPPAWTQHLHLLSTGLLILAVIALSFAAFGPNGLGGRNGGTGDGPGHFSAVPVATVPDDAVTSSIPYPTAEECTVEPMTREELTSAIQEANTATLQTYQRYERSIEASEEEAEAIMQTFREWQACGLRGKGSAYEMQFQTPWYTAHQLSIFHTPNGDNLRPVSDEKINDFVDVLLTDEGPATPVASFGTPPSLSATPERLPIPEGGTPVTSPYGGGGGPPTIFAEDIVMNGPDTAMARAYFVVPETGQVIVVTPLTYGFVNVDGQWLINSYREGTPG